MRLKIRWPAFALALALVLPTAHAVRAADVKVSALPAASAMGATDLLPVVQGTCPTCTTKAATGAQVKTWAQAGLAASATTDTTNASNITSGTLPAAQLPNPSASTLGGVKSLAAVSHQFLTSISTAGLPTQAQPAAADISGLAASATTDTTSASNITTGTLPAAQLPNPSASTLGGVKSLAAVSHQFLTQISTAGLPAQAQPAAADISGLAASATTDATNATNISSGTLPAARLPNPSATTLGGVESLAAVTHKFLTAISTAGVPAQAQPACADLSDATAFCNASATNGITLGNIAQSAANTMLGNWTGSTANVAANAMPSCSGTNSSLKFTSGTGVGCNSNTATLGANTFTATQAIDGAAATNRTEVYSTSGSTRWQTRANNTAESGSNVGSDFAIDRFTDAGAYIDTPVTVTRSTGILTLQAGLASAGQLGASGPQTKVTTYSVLVADYSLIFNGAGSITVTLPAASSSAGRILVLKTIASQTVISASSNVVPITTAVAGTAILAATAGKWAMLQSDGSNWITMMAN